MSERPRNPEQYYAPLWAISHPGISHTTPRTESTSVPSMVLRQYGKVQESEPALLSHLLLSHQGLVHGMAGKLRRGKSDFDDLAQEGQFGLMGAVERFDPEKGDWAGFATTHVVKRIKGAQDWGTVDISGKSRFRGVQNEVRYQTDQRGRVPTDAEVAAMLPQTTEAFVHGVRSFALSSLDTQEGQRWWVAQSDPDAEALLNGLVDLRSDRMRARFAALEPCEGEALNSILGLEGKPELSYKEAGAELGVSKDTIRQRVITALQYLATGKNLTFREIPFASKQRFSVERR